MAENNFVNALILIIRAGQQRAWLNVRSGVLVLLLQQGCLDTM